MLLVFCGKKVSDLRPYLKSEKSKRLAFYPLGRSISRLRYKPDLLKFILASEFLPDLARHNQKSKNWEECCAHRALNLLSLNKSRYYLSYSGGIDSSVALISLLKYWPTHELKKLVVYLNSESIRENPQLFKSLISKLKMVSSYVDISKKLMEENSLLITGDLGDQLFGSDILEKGISKFGFESQKSNYLDMAPRYLAILGNGERGEWVKEAFEHIHPIIEECPFPIRSTFDFFWWWNFSQKWQFVKYRFAEREEWDLKARYGEHFQHFYDDIEFQRWSLQNHDLKLGKDWKSYKRVSKDFIFNFTNDPSTYDLQKVPSLHKNYSFNRKRAAVDENWNEVSYKQIGEKYVL